MKERELDLRLIAELMKNSRQSDRELARKLGCSQPTITRMRNRLEKEGYIKEYTAIPDFVKVGYTLLAITFVKLRRHLTQSEIAKARESARSSIIDNHNFIMLERGMGLGYDGVFISLHEDYSSFTESTEWLKQFDFLELADAQSFIVNLKGEVRYRPLTLSTLALHMLKLQTWKGHNLH